MSTQTDQSKIKIEWDDLKSRKVDQRLKQQEAIERNRKQAEMNPIAAEIDSPASTSIWRNSIFVMAVFGLLGGLLAWGGGEILRFRPDPKLEAKGVLQDIGSITSAQDAGRITAETAHNSIHEIEVAYRDNPYIFIYTNRHLSPAERDEQLHDLDSRQSRMNFIANLVSFGLCGMFIATCLSIAEPVMDHNTQGALVNGSVGATLGLVGGVVVSLFVDRLYNALLSVEPTIAHAVSWGVLGLFLMIGPGLVMRNTKKLIIGLAGGLIGGLAGGALFDFGGNAHISRLIALLAIGIIAGAGTGLIENAAKSGWLKVTSGLIAGKQFILYRNPTFIGSGPECQIYLFKDAKVGRRHAAVHIVPGGFELENLPLGVSTLVNGREIQRTRLHNGDRIQIGGSSFCFQEKEKGGKAEK
jgi:hypothetical protein